MDFRKYLAEMFGTMVLVLLGCGTAVSLHCGVDTASVIGTALAFGLAVVGMAYCIGGISGCHINPAITLGVWLSGRMSGRDAIWYMVYQCVGGFLGAAILYGLALYPTGLEGHGMGANTCSAGVDIWGGLLAEAVFTAVFVFVVLGATDGKVGADKMGGLAIGLTLVLVHLMCIAYTGTSVNPARSIGPAIFAQGEAIRQLWIFIVGPLLGACVAAGMWAVIAPLRTAK